MILRRVSFYSLILAMVNFLVATSSGAQASGSGTDQSDPWSGVEEMVITAQAIEGMLATTGAAVVSFDSATLEALGVADVGDLAEFTPNLEIKTAGATSATLFIRGIGLNDFTANGSGSVAVYQDNVPLNLPAIQLGQLFDVSQVQVIKGPIGSGSGRNASAGAIKAYSNKPSGELASGLRFDYGNYEFKDAEGYLEVPMIDDVLSSRFAFRFTERDGIMKNRCAELSEAERMSPTACGSDPVQVIPGGLSKNLNDLNNWAIRGLTRFVPPVDGLDMDWLMGLHLSRIDQLQTVGQSFGAREGNLGYADAGRYIVPEIQRERDKVATTLPPFPGPGACRRNPNALGCDSPAQVNAIMNRRLAKRPLDSQPFEGDYNRDGHERQSSWGGFLRGEWQLEQALVSSITGYEYYNRERLLDADFSPNVLFEFDIADSAWQATQEFGVEGELSQLPISWKAGAYALFEELDYRQDTLPGVNPGIFKIDQRYEQETQSFAFYGEGQWEIFDDLEFEAGARYNWERKSIDADVVIQNNPLCLNSSIRPGPLVCKDAQTFDHPTGLVKLKYSLSEATTVSLKYSRGWKGQQYNVRDGQTQLGAIDLANPEKVDAFEWGFTSEWFEERLNLQGALFWYDYQDYQVFTFSNELGSPPQRIVVNANDAQLYGAELEARIEPVERLVVDVRFGWLEGKFLDFSEITRINVVSNPNTPPNVVQIPIDYSGNRLPNTPRFKVSLSAEYTFELDRLGELVPRYDMSWTDDIFFDQSEGIGARGVSDAFLPDYTVGQRAYALHNVRLTYKAPGGSLEVAGWVRNLTNELYKTTAFNSSRGVQLIGNYVGNPRMYGLSTSFKF